MKISYKILNILFLSISLFIAQAHLTAGAGPSREAKPPYTGLRDVILNNHEHEALKLSMEERKAIALLEDDEVIHWAATCGHLTILHWIKSVTKYDLNDFINEIDCFGDTPLHKAAFMGHSEVVAFLLTLDADSTIRNECGYTPYNLAINEEYDEAASLIQDSLAQKNAHVSYLCIPHLHSRNNRVEPLDESERFLREALEVIHALSMYSWQEKVLKLHHDEKLFKNKVETRVKQLNKLMDCDDLDDLDKIRAQLIMLPLTTKIWFSQCANRYLQVLSRKWDNCYPPMTADERSKDLKKSEAQKARLDMLKL